MYWASFCQDGWSLCYFYTIFLLLWATQGVWDFFSMLSGLTAAKECHAGLPFLIAWPMQRPSLTCSLSATKPLLPLCSSPGNSALVKEEGIIFPHVFPLENLSTLFLSMTSFPHNPNEMSSLPSSSSFPPSLPRRISQAVWSFSPIIASPSPETLAPEPTIYLKRCWTDVSYAQFSQEIYF